MDEQIISLLKQIKYPGFSRDIVSFGLVSKATLENRMASVKLELSSSEPTLPQSIRNSVEQCLLASDLIDEVAQLISDFSDNISPPAVAQPQGGLGDLVASFLNNRMNPAGEHATQEQEWEVYPPNENPTTEQAQSEPR